MRKAIYKNLFLALTLLIGILNCRIINPTPTYIFLITLDTTRADHINYSLSQNDVSPNFARLASNGVFFKNAYSLIPITLPSHASMFYSLPPYVLKIYNNAQKQDVSHASLAEILKSKGYQTGAVVSLGVLNAQYGLNKGFEEYIENYSPNLWYKTAEEVNRDAFGLIRRFAGSKSFFWIHYSDPHEPYFPPLYSGSFNISLNNKKVFTSKSIEAPVVNLTLEIPPGANSIDLETELPISLEKNEEVDIPYFFYCDFFIKPIDTNDNIEVSIPKTWKKDPASSTNIYISEEKKSQVLLINKGKKNALIKLSFLYRLRPSASAMKDLYEKEVTYMDTEFGKLIDYLKENKMYKKSFFIVVGDHGEGLGEHLTYFGHVHYLNNIYVKVPLIMAGTGLKKKGEREELASNLNIAPTILDVVRIKKPGYMLGQSLLKPFKSDKLLLETYSPEAYHDTFSIIKLPYQVIFHPERKKDRFELINLKKDPLGIDVISDEKQDQEIFFDLKKSLRKISTMIKNTKGKIGKLSQKELEILKSLGYIR